MNSPPTRSETDRRNRLEPRRARPRSAAESHRLRPVPPAPTRTPACAAIKERTTRRGQGELARGAMNQSGPDLGLQLLYLAADRVGRHSQAPGRRGKAVGPHHFHEQKDVVQIEGGLLRFLDFIHPIMPYSQGIPEGLSSAYCLATRRNTMAQVLVLYYSSYGHIETMANAVAEGARAAGATVDIKRVPETVPADVAKASYFKLDQKAPVANDRRARQLRRHHCRCPNALRTDVFADGRLPGSGRWFVDERRVERQSGRRLFAPRQPNTAARKRPSSRSSPTCCISG